MNIRQTIGIIALAASTVVAAQDQGRGRGQGQPQGVREVTVSAIPGVVAAGAKWTLAWGGSDNADGLVATADGGVLFAQEQPKRVSKLDRQDRVSTYVADTHGAGSLAVDGKGRLFAVERTCTDPGLRAPCSEPTRISILYPADQKKVLADSVAGNHLGRLNDLVVGRNGSVYFTSGGAFRLTPAGMVERIGENLRTNGIMLSPDEKTLYITNGATVVALDVHADGSVGNQRDFAHLAAGGAGDGLAIDAAGRLYVTSQPGVQVFAADGKYLGLIPTPRAVISATFSGADRKMLYVVGSGALDATGAEMTTAPGVRNNAKSIFRIAMIAQGFASRPK
jgi:gluconolactonase